MINPNVLKFWLPPPNLSLSTWADQYAYLSPESSHEPGRWTSLPYQRGIMDAFTDPTVEMIVFKKSARVGYTKILNHMIGYCIHQDPKSVLMVQPTVEDAQGYSKEELAPMLRDTPALENLVGDSRSRDSNNTILKKSYSGGFIVLVGANSARGFRRMSMPIVLFDEVDGYPPSAGQEGDQIKLGIIRSQYFWNRKIGIGSTPTTKDLSKVQTYFETTDQRYYYVPCPHCKQEQALKWGGRDADFGIKWPDGRPEDAYYLCEYCHEKIVHAKKRWMIERGDWWATQEFKGRAGFHIWAAYSYAPNASWGNLAIEFLESKDNAETLKVFTNTVLGEVFEEQGDRPEWSALYARCEAYEPLTAPEHAKVLTAGVDTQDDRLAVAIYAWGVGEECWLVYFTEIMGDPAEDQVWDELDGLLERNFSHPSGNAMKVVSVAIDTQGHRTHYVYNYCRVRFPKVIAIQGANARNKPIIAGKPSKKDVTIGGETIKGGVMLWSVGTDTAKATIYSRLKKEGGGPGCFHWYIGAGEEYFKQLTAEMLQTRYVKGFPVSEWHNVRWNKRNEALDCTVYAYAALQRIIHQVDLSRPVKSAGKKKDKPKQDQQPQTPKPRPKKKKGGRW